MSDPNVRATRVTPAQVAAAVALALIASAVALIVVVFGALFLIGFIRGWTAAEPPRKNDQPVPQADKLAAFDWSQASDVFQFDHVKITVPYAVVAQTRGERYGRINNFSALHCRVEVENTSDVKVVRWSGWQGIGRVADEHGNLFEPASMRGYAFHDMPGKRDHVVPGKKGAGARTDGREPRVKDDAITDGERSINPETTTATFILFEPPPASSTEARITLPLSVLDPDSKESAHFRLPIEHPKKIEFPKKKR